MIEIRRDNNMINFVLVEGNPEDIMAGISAILHLALGNFASDKSIVEPFIEGLKNIDIETCKRAYEECYLKEQENEK